MDTGDHGLLPGAQDLDHVPLAVDLDHRGARRVTGAVTCTGIRNLGGLPMRQMNSPPPRRRRSISINLAGRLGVQNVDIDERHPGRGMAGPQPTFTPGH